MSGRAATGNLLDKPTRGQLRKLMRKHADMPTLPGVDLKLPSYETVDKVITLFLKNRRQLTNEALVNRMYLTLGGSQSKLPYKNLQTELRVMRYEGDGVSRQEHTTYKDFMHALYSRLRAEQPSIAKQNDGESRVCPHDKLLTRAEKQRKEVAPAQERMLAWYMGTSKDAPGVLLYHEVGSGKTRKAFSVLSQFISPERLLIWVTTTQAAKSLRTQTRDFRAFGTEKSPFFSVSRDTKEVPPGRIVVQTYAKFINALKNKNDLGRLMRTRIEGTGTKDILANAVVVIDEAHKIFEEDDPVAIEHFAFRSHRAAAKHGHDACKWIFLSATPTPGIDAPTSERKDSEKAQTTGGPYAALRLLNMLIPNKRDRFSIPDFGGQQATKAARARLKRYIPSSSEDPLIDHIAFANRARGLVSYFTPNWPKMYAAMARHSMSSQPHMLGNMKGKTDKGNTTTVAGIQHHLTQCATKASGKAKKLAESGDERAQRKARAEMLRQTAQCFRRRFHWFGKNQTPRASKGSSGLPGNLAKCIEVTKFECVDGPHDPKLPRARFLCDTIRRRNASDAQRYKTQFKHVVYTNSSPAIVAGYATALLKCGDGYEYRTPAARMSELNISWENAKKELNTTHMRVPRNNPRVMLYLADNASEQDVHQLVALWNHEGNANGAFAQLLMLGSKRKEALNLYDVKYMHILEPQLSETDTTQIEGRVRRMCGHLGIHPRRNRKVHVFTYDLVLPSDTYPLVTSTPEIEFSKSTIDLFLAVNPQLRRQLQIRTRILVWLENVAYDLPLSKTPPSVSRQDITQHVETMLAQMQLTPLQDSAPDVPANYMAAPETTTTKKRKRAGKVPVPRQISSSEEAPSQDERRSPSQRQRRSSSQRRQLSPGQRRQPSPNQRQQRSLSPRPASNRQQASRPPVQIIDLTGNQGAFEMQPPPNLDGGPPRQDQPMDVELEEGEIPEDVMRGPEDWDRGDRMDVTDL